MVKTQARGNFLKSGGASFTMGLSGIVTFIMSTEKIFKPTGRKSTKNHLLCIGEMNYQGKAGPDVKAYDTWRSIMAGDQNFPARKWSYFEQDVEI